MDLLVENTRKIFDVARRDPAAEDLSFTLRVCGNGSLHMIVDSPLSAGEFGDTYSRGEYRVVRSHGAVKVTGSDRTSLCRLEQKPAQDLLKTLVPDQALYRISSALLTS